MVDIEKIRLISLRFVFIYVLGFILTFPFPYTILPDIGGKISQIFESINVWWIEVFGLGQVTTEILSDSTGLYVHLITLLILSLIGTLLWWLIAKWRKHLILWQWFHGGIAYYLALTLLIYGFNKIFKWQFFFPEPNTLFTSIGEMTPDILFWSSIGSSYSYSLFSGLIEVIPALLLLFKKTRLVGGIMAMMVLLNVVMINFGFDISVKIYSLFLILLSIIVILPNVTPLVYFLSGRQKVNQKIYYLKIDTPNKLLLYAIGKPLVIGLILLEVLLPYFRTGNFNDDTFQKPYLHGAYEVINLDSNNNDTSKIKRVFIHRRGYFIIQSEQDKFESFDLTYGEDLSYLKITNSLDESFYFYVTSTNTQLELKGKFQGEHLNLVCRAINLDKLPINGDNFHWTIDSY